MDLKKKWWVTNDGDVMQGMSTHITRRVTGSTPKDAKLNANAIALLPSLLEAMQGNNFKAQLIRCRMLDEIDTTMIDQMLGHHYNPIRSELLFLRRHATDQNQLRTISRRLAK